MDEYRGQPEAGFDALGSAIYDVVRSQLAELWVAGHRGELPGGVNNELKLPGEEQKAFNRLSWILDSRKLYAYQLGIMNYLVGGLNTGARLHLALSREVAVLAGLQPNWPPPAGVDAELLAELDAEALGWARGLATFHISALVPAFDLFGLEKSDDRFVPGCSH